MARPKKGGAAARVRDSNSDFNPTKRSPTKNFTKGKSRSPQKKYINPRKGRKSEQEATVDQGIVAIPDNTLLQVQAQNDDSIYDSSPSKRIIISTSQPTPQQPSVRKDAARDNRSNKCIIDQSSGSFEAERAITTEVAAESATESKVVILRVTSHKLREILEIHIAQEKKVTLVLSPEKLRRFEKEPFAEELLPPPILRPEVPVVEEAAGMAPVKDKNPHDVLDDSFKDVIQNLYDMASITHGYLPESHGPLVNKSIDFTRSLAELSNLTADNSTHPAAQTIKSTLVPPEVIDYVFAGRNPDIYTREFVENVNRGNHVLNGKMQAFGSMAEIYARETKSAMPEMAPDMDRIMEHYGGFEKDAKTGDWKMKKSELGAEVGADMDRLMEHNGGFKKDTMTGDWKMNKPDLGVDMDRLMQQHSLAGFEKDPKTKEKNSGS